MSWKDIYSEDSIARADRLVTAMMGTVTNPHNEIFGNELLAVLAEIDADKDKNAGMRVIASLTGLAYFAVGRLGQLQIEAEGGEVDFDDDVASRNAEMVVLRDLVEMVDDFRRGDGTLEPL